MISSEQTKDFQERVEALSNYLKIEPKRSRVEEDEKITQQADFWNDPKKAQRALIKTCGKNLGVN